MALAFLVYLAGVLTAFDKYLFGVVFLLAVLTVITTLYSCIDNGTLHKNSKHFLIAVLVVSFIRILIPSERTMYVMAGAYAAQSIAENPNVQRISGKVITIIDQKLAGLVDEGIEEAKKATKKTVEEKTK